MRDNVLCQRQVVAEELQSNAKIQYVDVLLVLQNEISLKATESAVWFVSASNGTKTTPYFVGGESQLFVAI
jgi:hypothetical protein